MHRWITDMWVPELLPPPKIIRMFEAKSSHFCPKICFFFSIYRPCGFIWRRVGWLVGGCCALAVSRKTHLLYYGAPIQANNKTIGLNISYPSVWRPKLFREKVVVGWVKVWQPLAPLSPPLLHSLYTSCPSQLFIALTKSLRWAEYFKASSHIIGMPQGERSAKSHKVSLIWFNNI